MGTQFMHLAIKILPGITLTILSSIACHFVSLLLAAFSHLDLFKSPPDSDDYPSSSADHILILDSSSPSLLRVPVHVVTASIKIKVPIIPYSDSAHGYAGTQTAACMVCLDCIDDSHLIRELLNCEHVFHRECFDRWVDVGHVNCPLCRSMLLPPKKLLSTITTTAAVNLRD